LFDVKGVVEALADAFGVAVEVERASRPYFVEGRAGEVFQQSGTTRRPLGELGQIVPSVLESRGFPPNEALYAFELHVDALAALQPAADLRAESLPRFPSVVRDLSVLVDSGLPAAAVRGTIRSAAPDTLAHIVEFDRYRGQGVPEGRVSLSLRLTFRSSDRTLTDADVDSAMVGIVQALESAHGAERR
jgi:phenylalanyl-tRNA synthetase beta chain